MKTISSYNVKSKSWIWTYKLFLFLFLNSTQFNRSSEELHQMPWNYVRLTTSAVFLLGMLYVEWILIFFYSNMIYKSYTSLLCSILLDNHRAFGKTYLQLEHQTYKNYQAGIIFVWWVKIWNLLNSPELRVTRTGAKLKADMSH